MVRRKIIIDSGSCNLAINELEQRDAVSFHATSSCDTPGCIYFEYNLDNQNDWQSTALDIDDVVQYYKDVEWSIAPTIPTGSLDPNDPVVIMLGLL